MTDETIQLVRIAFLCGFVVGGTLGCAACYFMMPNFVAKVIWQYAQLNKTPEVKDDPDNWWKEGRKLDDED